jgi:methionyl-tRNA formyltransferase
MNGPAFLAKLTGSGADMLVTFHCDQILAPATIAALPFGGINVHAGLLPDHRGPTPTIFALLENPPRFGVTIHRLVPRIDFGPTLLRVPVDLPPPVTALEAASRLHEAAVPMLQDLLDRLTAGEAPDQPSPPGPYRGFPTWADLRDLARMGRHAAAWRDLWRALKTPV